MNLLTLKNTASPEIFARDLISNGPVFWSAPEQFWVVTDHSIAVSVLKSLDFSADRSSFFQKNLSACPFHKVANFFGVVKKMMVTSDPPLHTARRRLASHGIADHVLERFEPQVKAAVTSLLKSIEGRAEINFAAEIAVPLPNIVLADLFSIPTDRRDEFYRSANQMTQFFGGSSDGTEAEAERADASARHLEEYFKSLIKERRRHPADDFLTHLLQNQGELDESEVIAQAVIMLVAGSVTTTDQICNDLYTLLHTDSWPKLVQNRALIPAAIEEATRLDPSVNFMFRVAKKDQILGAQNIKAGDLVFVSTHAVNRDSGLFQNPHLFSMARRTNPHLSYGSGIHRCLGARLGRIQLQALFSAMADRYATLSFAERPPRMKHQSLAFSGFECFPLRMD